MPTPRVEERVSATALAREVGCDSFLHYIAVQPVVPESLIVTWSLVP